MNKLFNGPYVLLAYLIGVFTIFSGYYDDFYILFIGLILFFLWDLFYVLDDKSFTGRTSQLINDSVTRARTYISWYIGLYGIIIGFSLNQSKDSSPFAMALDSSAIPFWALSLPLIFSIISMLFIPIQISSDESIGDNPSLSLKCLFFFVIYIQKVILILIGYFGFRILVNWQIT